MDVIYRKGRASAADVHAALPDAPSYSAIRALLRILERKGHLTHAQDGPRYLYAPVVSQATARETALRGVVRTFFGGSPIKAVAALLDISDGKLTTTELNEVVSLIRRAKREGR